MAERQCRRRHDVGRCSGFALASQDVENDVSGMDAVTKRLGAGGFDRRQTVSQHRIEDVDHLSIAVVGAGEPAPDPFDRGRQHPVLEGCAVTQGPGFAREHRHVVPGIVGRLAASERPRIRDGVPALIELGRLLQITERILRDEETDEDLQLIFAPGSSLGGARPKASVIDQHGRLSIAKFPKETDDYSMETWEEIALRLAGQAGIATPDHELIEVAGKAVMLSRRFDRDGATRIPFLSAMAMIGARDGERGSYPEIVDALAQHGAQGKTDAHALYRRVVFNVLISNVDDHLRNHGFLWLGKAGWSLSPAYDLNPVPTDLKARVLTTNIDLDEGTCSVDLLEAASEFFALTLAQARTVIKEVATVTATWRDAAKAVGARSAEINRMASAFEHDDLKRALAL